MRRFYRFIVISTFLFSTGAHALVFFIDGIDWRATNTNDWAYVNSQTLPNQTLDYKTIDFSTSPGFRIGASYINTWDALISYTRYYTTTSETTTGNIQPSFSGSVTAKPSHAYLYESGQVHQSINYNIFDLDFGRRFKPVESFMLHPFVGLMGGSISQSIHAGYQGSTSTQENISNDFSGIGVKAGIDTGLYPFNGNNFNPEFFVAFAASYLLGHWDIDDVTYVNPAKTIFIDGANHSMGALTLQSSIGIKVERQNFAMKLAYEINDWFDQNQFFDNDTGAHNNDLVLQGVTLGLSYDFTNI